MDESNIINDFLNLSEVQNKKIGVFDLETLYLFNEIDPNWDNMNYKRKKSAELTIIPKLRISVAGILTVSNKIPIYSYYLEEQIESLLTELDKLDLIIGHNIVDFDYKILDSYSNNISTSLLPKTIDTLIPFQKRNLGWPSLNDLGKLNFNVTKTIDTLKIPEMWRAGKFEEVKEYLKRDLDLQAAIYSLGISKGEITIYNKKYGKIMGKNCIEIDFN
ncbi:MAG: hypothetical protein OEY49_05525 [Candidatus Heimdallarchaeota archaeon]|nr:hypothetical protein [Candidatus Heimdallarchaeota archaeon]